MRKILRVGAWTSVLTANLLFGQFKRADHDQSLPPYPIQPQEKQTMPDGTNNEAPDELMERADVQHGVARVSFVNGQVNVQRSGSGGTVAAVMNAPLLSEDRLQTGAASSAEVQLDAGTLIRLAQNSNAGFGVLEESRFQLQLGIGTVIYRVLQPSQMGGELDTPNIAIRPLGLVSMRVSVLDDGTTEIWMRQGEAEIVGPQGAEKLEAGHAYVVRGNPADPEFQEVALAPQDEFDIWSDGRDQEVSNSQSAQYMGQDVSGAAELDANGTWVPSEYGAAWTPSGMPANWAPYSNGLWSYENYYGWTWVDNASWGWAPYHYGRWFRNAGYGWCWWPGQRLGVHRWRPAVVGFYGFNGGYSGIGWVPLAPRERFYCWWGSSGRPFGSGVGGSYASFRNAGFRGAVTFASYNNFGGPGQRFGHLSRQQLSGASVLAGQIPVAPNRSGYSFSQRQAYSIERKGNYVDRSFVSVERSRNFVSGRSSDRSFRDAPTIGTRRNWNRVGAQPTASPSRGAPGVNPQSPGAGVSKWQRFGDPGRSYRQGFSGGGSSNTKSGNESGWHEFGRPTAPSNSRQWNAPTRGQRFDGGGTWNGNQPRSNGGGQQRFSPPSRQSPRGRDGGNRGGRR